MIEFLKKCWTMRNTEFVLTGDDTYLPYTRRGPRQEFNLIIEGFLSAHWYAHRFVLMYPKGAVYINPKEK